MGLFQRFRREWAHATPQSAPAADPREVSPHASAEEGALDDDSFSIVEHLHHVHNLRHHKHDLTHEALATYSILPSEYICGDYDLDKERLRQIQKVRQAIDDALRHPISDEKRSLAHKYGKMTETLGKGSYGLIRLVEGKQVYALKHLKVSAKEDNTKFIERILAEFVIGSCVSHCHVSRVVDLLVTYDGSAIKLGQLIPFSNGGDLFSYMQNDGVSSIDQLDCFVKQIALGLEYLHLKGISHCDIKMENVLVNYEDPTATNSKVTLSLGDFGKSQFCKTSWGLDDSQTLPLGSEPYMAPEEYEGQPYSTFAKDCWSFGILLTVIFTSRKPFTHIYPWKTTAFKVTNDNKTYIDPAFCRYTKSTLVGSYDNKMKEWCIKKNGSFNIIEKLFDNEEDSDGSTVSESEYDAELNKLRQLFIYKFLDINPKTRMTITNFVHGDWMTGVDVCMEYDD